MLLKVFVFVSSLVFICESAFVDSLIKCSKDDAECHKNLIKMMMEKIAKEGAEEFGIPPTDPLVVKDMTIDILNVQIVLVDGTIKGAKNCVIHKFLLNVETLAITLDITCDLVVKGHYKVFSNDTVIQSLVGAKSIHGDGKGKVKMDKVHLIIVIPYEFVKRGDDIFLEGKSNKITFTYDIGNMVFAANKLFLGDVESSATVVKLLNDNWKIIVQTFGKDFIKKAIDVIHGYINNIFKKVSTKHYLIEDMSSYVKN